MPESSYKYIEHERMRWRTMNTGQLRTRLNKITVVGKLRAFMEVAAEREDLALLGLAVERAGQLSIHADYGNIPSLHRQYAELAQWGRMRVDRLRNTQAPDLGPAGGRFERVQSGRITSATPNLEESPTGRLSVPGPSPQEFPRQDLVVEILSDDGNVRVIRHKQKPTHDRTIRFKKGKQST